MAAADKKLMTQISLSYLMALQKESEPMTAKELAAKHDLKPANTILARMAKMSKIIDSHPDRKYTINRKGKKVLAEQLALAPFEEHPEGGANSPKGKKPRKKAEDVTPQQPELNLSPTAEGFMDQVQAVIAENDFYRSALTEIHNRLGAILYGTSGTEKTGE